MGGRGRCLFNISIKEKRLKKALITGITGQDGSYLAEYLVSKNYKVYGMIRRVAIENSCHRTNRLNGILKKIILYPATLENYASIYQLVDQSRPDECYHLAAQSFVAESFEDPYSTRHEYQRYTTPAFSFKTTITTLQILLRRDQ